MKPDFTPQKNSLCVLFEFSVFGWTSVQQHTEHFNVRCKILFSHPVCGFFAQNQVNFRMCRLPVFNGDAVAIPTIELCLVVAGVDVDLEALSPLRRGGVEPVRPWLRYYMAKRLMKIDLTN